MRVPEAGLWYLKKWGLNVVFTDSLRRPLHKWKKYYVKRQTQEEVKEIIRNLKRYPRGVAGVINPEYLEGPPYYAVLDIEQKGGIVDEVVNELAKETPVVVTYRGYHVWFKTEKTLPYISIEGEFDLLTEKHLAQLPPSLRRVGYDEERGKYKYMIYEFNTRRLEESMATLFGRKIPLSDEERIIIRKTNLISKSLKIERKVKIRTLKLKLDDLSDTAISVLLYLLFREAECYGMKKIVETIGRKRICPVPKRMYTLMQIPRTTRWLIQYAFATVLGYLGVSRDRVEKWLLSWRFIDENRDPREDSLPNALYNVYSAKNYMIIPRGACPFCLLMNIRNPCDSTPFIKIRRLGVGRIKMIERKIKTASAVT